MANLFNPVILQKLIWIKIIHYRHIINGFIDNKKRDLKKIKAVVEMAILLLDYDTDVTMS